MLFAWKPNFAAYLKPFLSPAIQGHPFFEYAVQRHPPPFEDTNGRPSDDLRLKHRPAGPETE